MYHDRDAISVNCVNKEPGRSCLIDDDEENEADWRKNRCIHNELGNGKTGVSQNGDNTNKKKNKTKWVQLPLHDAGLSYPTVRPSLYELRNQENGINCPVNVWKNKKGSELFVKKEVDKELVSSKKSSPADVDCTAQTSCDDSQNEVSEEHMLVKVLEESVKTYKKEEEERHRAMLIAIANLSEDEILGGTDSNSKSENTVPKKQKRENKVKMNNGHDRNNNLDSKKNKNSSKDYIVGYRLVRDEDIEFKNVKDGTHSGKMDDETLRFVTMTFNNSNNTNNESKDVKNYNNTVSCNRKKSGKSHYQKNEPVKYTCKLKNNCKLEKNKTDIKIDSSNHSSIEIKENTNSLKLKEDISSSHIPQSLVKSVQTEVCVENGSVKLSSDKDLSNSVTKEKSVGILKNVPCFSNIEKNIPPFSHNVKFNINREGLEPNRNDNRSLSNGGENSTVIHMLNRTERSEGNVGNLDIYATTPAISPVSKSSISTNSSRTSVSDSSDCSSVKSVWSSSQSLSDPNIQNMETFQYSNCGQNMSETNPDSLKYMKISSNLAPPTMHINNQSVDDNDNLYKQPVDLSENQTTSIVNSLRNVISEIVKTNDNDIITYIMSQILKDNFNKLSVNHNATHTSPGIGYELRDKSNVHSLNNGTVPFFEGQQYSAEDPRGLINQSHDEIVNENFNHQEYDEVKNYVENAIYQNQIPFHMHYLNQYPQLVPYIIQKQEIPIAHQFSSEEILLLSQNSQMTSPEISQPFVRETSSEQFSMQPPGSLNQFMDSQRPSVQVPVKSLNEEEMQGLQFTQPELSETSSACVSSQMRHPFAFQSQIVPQQSDLLTPQRTPSTSSSILQIIEPDYLQSRTHPSSMLQHEVKQPPQPSPLQTLPPQNFGQTVPQQNVFQTSQQIPSTSSCVSQIPPQNFGQTVPQQNVFQTSQQIPSTSSCVSQIPPQNFGQTVPQQNVFQTSQQIPSTSSCVSQIPPQNFGQTVPQQNVFQTSQQIPSTSSCVSQIPPQNFGQTVPQQNVFQTSQQIPSTSSCVSQIPPQNFGQTVPQQNVFQTSQQIPSTSSCVSQIPPQNFGQTVPQQSVFPTSQQIPSTSSSVSQIIEPDYLQSQTHPSSMLQHDVKPFSQPAPSQTLPPQMFGQTVLETAVPSFTQTNPPEYLQSQIYWASILEQQLKSQQMLQPYYFTYQYVPQCLPVPMDNNLAAPAHQSVSNKFMENPNGISNNNNHIDQDILQHLKAMTLSEKNLDNCYQDNFNANKNDLVSDLLQGTSLRKQSEFYDKNSTVNPENHQSMLTGQVNCVNHVNNDSSIINGIGYQTDFSSIRGLNPISSLHPSLLNDDLSVFSENKPDSNILGLENCSPNKQGIVADHQDLMLTPTVSSSCSQPQFGIGHSKCNLGQVSTNHSLPKTLSFHPVLLEQRKHIRNEFLQIGLISKGRGRLNL